MTKESSSKKNRKASHDGPIVEQEKATCVKPKKMGSEIDAIFARKKRKIPEIEKKGKKANMKKPAKASTGSTEWHDKMKIGKNTKIKDLKENPFAEPISRPRKKTGGLAIYTEEELGIGKSDAGGTQQCPFDCDCCF